MTALRRIGGPNAITGWSFALTAVVFAIATLLPTTRDRITGPAEPRLAVAMLATGAAFAVLVLARATVLRGAARPPRPVVALAVFALAGVVQALALMALRPRFGLVPLDPGLLIATRAAAGVVWLSIVAILVDEVRSHNERVAELTARIGALCEVRDREDADRAATVRVLRDETLDPLRRALDAIGQSLGGGGGAERARAEADRVRRLVEDEVRPASHALLDREAAAEDLGRSAILARRARLRLVVRLAASSLAAPTWLAVGLPLVIAMLFALQGIGLAFALVVSLSWVVVMSACFGVGRRVLDPRVRDLPVGMAAALLVLAYLGLAMVAMANNWFWGFLSPLGRWLEWPSLFVLPALWIGIALSRAAQAEREETEARLAETASELAVAEARSTVVLTAAPGAGSTFGGWGGACSGTASTCTVTLAADTSVTATFAAADASGGGDGPAPTPSQPTIRVATPSRVLVGDAATIITVLTAAEAGRVVQSGSARGQGRVCRDSAALRSPGRVALRCTLDRAARRALTRAPLAVRLRTTFTGVSGAVVRRERVVAVRRAPAPQPSPVTG